MYKQQHVANTLRQLRESRKISVNDLAGQCQVHPKLIEELESGELVSSIAPLLKLARGLGVRLSTFLDDSPTDAPVVSRSSELKTAVQFSGAGSYGVSTLDFLPLAKNERDRHMEPFIVDVHPAVPEETTFSFHEGEEFIYVLSGRIEVSYGEEVYALSPGDSIYYHSTTPHQVQALDNADARILAVIYA
jgi:transcriptional regulator with XRE-family HTH domain